MTARTTRTNGLNAALAAQVQAEIDLLSAGFQADFDAEAIRLQAIRDVPSSSKILRFFRKGA